MGIFRRKKERKPAGPRHIALALAVFVVVIVAAVLLALRQDRLYTGTVRLGDTLVRVDVATTAKTWERGLSGRSSLAPDQGMLFLFPGSARYAFWMKDMRFPIDIVWIDKGAIVDITTDAAVPDPNGGELIRYFPVVPADTVLEVPAGFAQEHGLRTGMAVAVAVDR